MACSRHGASATAASRVTITASGNSGTICTAPKRSTPSIGLRPRWGGAPLSRARHHVQQPEVLAER
jgi:hypothetical protein